VLILLALPLVRFWLTHPDEYTNRLSLYGSYWVKDMSLLQKLWSYINTYLSGLNPFYWFFPHARDLPVHTMRGYGHIHWTLLPFVLAGLWRALKQWRLPEMRVPVIALLAAPTGAAMIGITVNRSLSMVIPAVLLAAIGIQAAFDWLETRRQIRRPLLSLVLLTLLTAGSLGMLNDALRNGPTWYSNYTLSGLQYGAQQVYSAASDYLHLHPDKEVIISPNWTFQSEIMRQFFIPNEPRIRMGTADYAINKIDPDIATKVFVFTPQDYQKVMESGRFNPPQVDLTLPYPDGKPGFYFTRLEYRPDVEQIMRAEREEHLKLIQESIVLDGTVTLVAHSQIEGDIARIFDGNFDTLVKTRRINPLIIEMEFNEAVSLSGLSLRIGSEAARITVSLITDAGKNYAFVQEIGEGEPYKDVSVPFGTALTVKKIRIEKHEFYAPDDNLVHLWELTLNHAP
jgi:hypothetical protein